MDFRIVRRVPSAVCQCAGRPLRWLLLAGLLGSVGAQAHDVPPEALALALQAVYEKPQGLNGAPFQPSIVTAPGLPGIAPVTVFGTEAIVRTRAEAREAQLAWFVYLSKLEATPESVLIEYEKPFSAHFGTLRLKREGGIWALAEHEKMRSSSGARLFYGELYNDIPCRDGTEMARRWVMPRGAPPAAPAVCPAEEFPEVAAYRQAKRLGLIR